MLSDENNPAPWKEAEVVAGIFEKVLTPGARVDVDQLLPDLVTGDLRQCDVVVRYGCRPREFMAIVEVQRRGRKPEIGDFDGWVEKMRGVGANLLICVTSAGFPESIVNSVHKKHHGAVKLVTLADLESAQWPEFLLFRSLPFEECNFEVTGVRFVCDSRNAPADKMGPIAKTAAIFDLDGIGEMLNINDVVKSSNMLDSPHFVADGVIRRTTGRIPGDGRLWLRSASGRHPLLEIEVTLEVCKTVHVLEPAAMKYQGALEDGNDPVLLRFEATLKGGTLVATLTFQWDASQREFRTRADVLSAPAGIGPVAFRVFGTLVDESPRGTPTA